MTGNITSAHQCSLVVVNYITLQIYKKKTVRKMDPKEEATRRETTAQQTLDKLIHKKYDELRSKLVKMHYDDPLSLESMPLVEKLFSALVATTDAYNDLNAHYDDLKAHTKKLEKQVAHVLLEKQVAQNTYRSIAPARQQTGISKAQAQQQPQPPYPGMARQTVLQAQQPQPPYPGVAMARQQTGTSKEKQKSAKKAVFAKTEFREEVFEFEKGSPVVPTDSHPSHTPDVTADDERIMANDFKYNGAHVDLLMGSLNKYLYTFYKFKKPYSIESIAGQQDLKGIKMWMEEFPVIKGLFKGVRPKWRNPNVVNLKEILSYYILSPKGYMSDDELRIVAAFRENLMVDSGYFSSHHYTIPGQPKKGKPKEPIRFANNDMENYKRHRATGRRALMAGIIKFPADIRTQDILTPGVDQRAPWLIEKEKRVKKKMSDIEALDESDKEFFKLGDYRVRDVPGDGNCLLYALTGVISDTKSNAGNVITYRTKDMQTFSDMLRYIATCEMKYGQMLYK